MISKKNLSRKLKLLSALLKEYETFVDEQWKKDAFVDALSMSLTISSKVEAEEYDEAIRLWGQLERFISDSVPVNEAFLSKYLPLRQALVNFGLNGS
jgi:hypothetical protein